jgi:hypothetical protein
MAAIAKQSLRRQVGSVLRALPRSEIETQCAY